MRNIRTVLTTALLSIAATGSLIAVVDNPDTSTPPAQTVTAVQQTVTAVQTAIAKPPAPNPPLHSRRPIDKLPTTMQWNTQCPTGYHFCANFPYFTGDVNGNFPGYGNVYKTAVYDSASSHRGKLLSFQSEVFIAADGKHFCSNPNDKLCDRDKFKNATQETYFVSILTSKHADPHQAIHAINGGDIVEAYDTTVRDSNNQDHPAMGFAHGIYGGRGLAVAAFGKVFYVEAVPTNLEHGDTRFIDTFLAGFRLMAY